MIKIGNGLNSVAALQSKGIVSRSHIPETTSWITNTLREKVESVLNMCRLMSLLCPKQHSIRDTYIALEFVSCCN